MGRTSLPGVHRVTALEILSDEVTGRRTVWAILADLYPEGPPTDMDLLRVERDAEEHILREQRGTGDVAAFIRLADGKLSVSTKNSTRVLYPE